MQDKIIDIENVLDELATELRNTVEKWYVGTLPDGIAEVIDIAQEIKKYEAELVTVIEPGDRK